MIADVSLRLVYLILDRFLSWLLLLGRTSPSKDVEQLSRPVDEDLYRRLRVGGGFVGSFDELAGLERRAGADERDQVRALTARQRSWAASMSLNAIASPAAREPGPRVILVRCRTVAKVDSIGFVVRR